MTASRTGGGRLRRRGGVVGALVIGLSVVSGSSALADPATPTHYRSTVVEVIAEDGSPVDLAAEVLGGDAFLVVSAPTGSVLEVPGYEGEPYIRIDPDGSVTVNQRSPARWLNDGRYGALEVSVPATASPEAPPEWLTVAGSGTYAWHDHRIHVMSPERPASIDPDRGEAQRVWEWSVPVTVDGQAVVITGVLDWVPNDGPAWPLAAGLLLLAVGIVIARRNGSATTVVVAVAAIVALGLGSGSSLGLPPGVEGMPALLVLPALALVACGVGASFLGRKDVRGQWLVGLAAIPLLVTVALQAAVLWRPIAPGTLPTDVVRIGVVAVLALSAAALIVVTGRALQRPEVTGDGESTSR